MRGEVIGHGFHGLAAPQKPLITRTITHRHLEWCKQRPHWNVNQWKKVCEWWVTVSDMALRWACVELAYTWRTIFAWAWCVDSEIRWCYCDGLGVFFHVWAQAISFGQWQPEIWSLWKRFRKSMLSTLWHQFGLALFFISTTIILFIKQRSLHRGLKTIGWMWWFCLFKAHTWTLSNTFGMNWSVDCVADPFAQKPNRGYSPCFRKNGNKIHHQCIRT